MSPADSYRAWLARRVEEGNDLSRVMKQLRAWRAKPPEGTTAALFAEMMENFTYTPAKKAKAAPPADGGAFG
jgi:hypothetical protein